MSNDYSDFFDENGELVETQWEKEQRLQREQEEARERKKQHRKDLQEVNRRIGIDDQIAKYQEDTERKLENRRKREEYMNMPQWIKDLPRTPMTAPPTEGTKEMMRYKLTKKVTLTESEERKRRVENARVKSSMELYKKISQEIPHQTTSVSVISIQPGFGSTSLTAGLSLALSESRMHKGPTFSIDLGSENNDMEKWFFKPNKSHTIGVKNIVNQVTRDNENALKDIGSTEILPAYSKGNFYLINDKGKKREDFKNNTIRKVARLHQYIVDTTPNHGVILFDCDPMNMELVLTSLALTTTHIFLIPANSKADVLLIDFFNKISDVFTNQEEIDKILDNSIVVLVGRSPKMAGKEASIAMKSLVVKSAKSVGIDEDRTFVIPFDKSLTKPPIKWSQVSFVTKHMLRSICAVIVEDAVGIES
mgnify:CR=1 FL=1